MPGSEAEEEIRAAVVDRLRELMPKARIIHELNTSGTGSLRVDLAAVDDETIIGVEIKSERDTLSRLQRQWDVFNRTFHETIVVAHRKHWNEAGDRLEHDLSRKSSVFLATWMYPKPVTDAGFYRAGRWNLPKAWRWSHSRPEQPRAANLLQMLWRDELKAECSKHQISVTSRATRTVMIGEMVWLMTGREICQAVCRQLRQRDFARADPPITEGKSEQVEHEPELPI